MQFNLNTVTRFWQTEIYLKTAQDTANAILKFLSLFNEEVRLYTMLRIVNCLIRPIRI